MKPELYYPIKPILVTQSFSQNLNPSYLQRGQKGHGGIDFKAYHGQPIYASHDGVCFPTVDDHGGNGIVLQAEPVLQNFFTIYWHLIQDDAVVQTNQKVKAGDLLGYADNTGNSTGDHLHFGLTIYPADFNNGYQGHIDPQPYFNGKFAEDINNPPVPVKFQFTKTLKIGSWNTEVGRLQTLLASQTLYNGKIDGIYGKMTDSAVRAFQLSNGLINDGIVGIKTRAVLNKLI